MDQPIINDIETLEQERQRIQKKRILIFFLIIIASIAIGFYAEKFEASLFFIFFGYNLAILLTALDTKYFKKAYKRLIILEIFKKFFTNINYLPETGLSYDIIENLDILDYPDQYTSNDYISATYNNINFESADILLEAKSTNSKGNTYYETLFGGQWYIFDFNKSFKSDVQILDSTFINTTRNSFFDYGFNKIQLEDIEFNNEFSVFAKNDYDVFYILTPHTLEKLKALKKKIKGNLIFCFKDSKLHIGVNNKRDSFEPNMYLPIDVKKAEEQTLQEINDIINFINDLDLDNSLFRKEV